MNVEADDRLSSLSDDLIHKIIAFISIKQAIEMSTLSSRWRFIWTTLPYLNFSIHDFSSLPKFSTFVTHVQSRRNTQIDASSVKLRFRGKINQVFVKDILDYAFSHNVQQMIVSRDYYSWDEFKLSLFISHSLKHLTIVGLYDNPIHVLSTWDLPALTTLYLKNIGFNNVITDKCIGIFSKCPNLKNLTLNQCSLINGPVDVVEIYHPGLVNLTLENGNFNFNVLNVVTPHLKNLIIREWSQVHLVSAPELSSFRLIKGSNVLQISQKALCSLETVDLCIYKTYKKQKSNETDAHKIVDVLQGLHNAKFLTLNLEIIQVLSPFVDLISRQPSPFENLKSLKIYPYNVSLKVQETIPIEVQNYLLDGSPDAIFTTVSCKALNNAISAQKRMAKLQWMLEKEQTMTETNMYRANAPMDDRHVENKNVEIQPVAKMKLQIVGMMSVIKSCWKYIGRTTSMFFKFGSNNSSETQNMNPNCH